MRKIASATELQHELHRILAYSQSDHPSRQRIASNLQRLSLRLAATEDPDIPLRQQAFSRAKDLAADRFKSYGKPLRQAAKAYYDALDKTVSEGTRHQLAADVVNRLDIEIQANQGSLRVMEKLSQIFLAVAADHNRLSHVE